MDEINMRCFDCSGRFEWPADPNDETPFACPHCGSTHWPYHARYDVTLTINWADLRILCFWADRWISQFLDNPGSQQAYHALVKIINRIQRHAPEGAGPLTLGDEVEELKREFGQDNVQVIEQSARPGTTPVLRDATEARWLPRELQAMVEHAEAAKAERDAARTEAKRLTEALEDTALRLDRMLWARDYAESVYLVLVGIRDGCRAALAAATERGR